MIKSSPAGYRGRTVYSTEEYWAQKIYLGNAFGWLGPGFRVATQLSSAAHFLVVSGRTWTKSLSCVRSHSPSFARLHVGFGNAVPKQKL